MEFCRFLCSVKFVVRSLGRFLGRGVCLWLQLSQGSRISRLDQTLSKRIQCGNVLGRLRWRRWPATERDKGKSGDLEKLRLAAKVKCGN